MKSSAALREPALEYLRREFEPQTAFELAFVASFSSSPLTGQGNHAIFSFLSSVGCEHESKFFVVTGEHGYTNYYPDWGLTVAQLWAVHLATTFYLHVGVKTLPAAADTTSVAAVRSLTRDVLQCEPDGPPVFDRAYFVPRSKGLASEVHIVGHLVAGSKPYTFVVGDCPSALFGTSYFPDLVWRLHFGQLLLNEQGGTA